MAIQNPRAPESAQFDETTRPATATGARRHRPSTRSNAESSTARRKRAKHERVEAATSRAATTVKKRAPQEDRREAAAEMVTDAKPRNLNAADKDSKKNKGKATHALEATQPGKRPSRKSTRGGANHIKADSQQARAVTRAHRSPQARHASRAA